MHPKACRQCLPSMPAGMLPTGYLRRNKRLDIPDPGARNPPVRHQLQLATRMANPKWLCALTVGRPPVCYTFFCDALMHSQSIDHNRDALRTLGRLLTNIGQNALGRRHLVEILDSDTLSRVNPNKIQTRLNDANSTLARIESTVLPVLTK